jgi:phage gp29-like protein
MQKTSDIIKTIADRYNSYEYYGQIFNQLPDPDPVLRKRGEDITVYKDLLSDPHVWSCVDSLKAGIASKEWELNQPEQGGKRVNQKAFDLAHRTLEKLDVYRIISEILDAPLCGISVLEVLWNKNYTIRDIVQRPVHWFIYDVENQLRFKSKSDMLYGELLPDFKFLVPGYYQTYENPYGERLLGKCFWSVTFKRGGLQFWNQFTEKYGIPFLFGKVPAVATDTERQNLLSMLMNMIQDAVGVTDDDKSIEALSIPTGTHADIFHVLVQFCNIEISKAILGQNLSTELDSGGSYAATQSHMDKENVRIQRYERLVCQTISQALRWQNDFNFTGAASPLFGFYQAEDTQTELASRDKVLTEQGVKFTKDYYKRVYNFQDRDFEVKELVPEQLQDKSKTENPVTEQNQEDKDEKQPEFKEPARFMPGPTTIESINSQAAAESRQIIENMLTPLMERISRAQSQEEILEILYVMYPELDTNGLQTLLENAMNMAGFVGNLTV